MRRHAILALLGGALACLPHEAAADTPARRLPYKKEVAGQYVFVMLPGRCQYVHREVEMTEAEWIAFQARQREEQHTRPCPKDNTRASFVDRWASELSGKWHVSIHSYEWMITKYLESEAGLEYPASGLYRNDGSTTPLWSVQWYAHQVYIGSDGIHLVRLGPWPLNYDDEAVTFFAHGEPIRSYKINELVEFPRLLPHSVSHFRWRADSRFDDQNLRFRIRTKHGEYYAFDVSTGEILSSFRLRRWAFGLGAPTLWLALVLGLRRRSFAQHIGAMATVSWFWLLVVVASDGDLVWMDLFASIFFGLYLIVLTGVALLPAGAYRLLKKRRMPGAIELMWSWWFLVALLCTYAAIPLSGQH